MTTVSAVFRVDNLSSTKFSQDESCGKLVAFDLPMRDENRG